MVIVQSLSREKISYDPVFRFLVVVKVNQTVIRHDVRAAQDNRKIPTTGTIIIVIHRHNADSVAGFPGKFQREKTDF
jgi:hypothetical protein